MNMMVSAAAITSAMPDQAPAASADHELIDLAEQLMQRLPDIRRANDRCNKLWDEFLATKIELSDVLKWRVGDDVDYTIEYLPDDKRALWCNPLDIAALSDVPQYDWSLPEINEAKFFALPEDDQLLHLGAPKPHVQHLFSKVPSATKQDRLNKLIVALAQYTEACDALKVELGCHQADEEFDLLLAPISEIADRMGSIEPTTIAGLQAKAKMLLYFEWDVIGDCDYGDDHPLAVEIIKGLVGAKLAA
jgi:hypothetical protein